MFLRFGLGAIFAAIFAVLLSGCSASDLRAKIAPERPEENYIQATRKASIEQGDRVRLVLIATHLSDQSSKHSALFFIDAYQSFDEGQKIAPLFANGYELWLENGDELMEPLMVKSVQKSEIRALAGEIAEQRANAWGEYYLVEFGAQNEVDKNALKLRLTHKNYATQELDFSYKALSKDDFKNR